MEQIVHEVTGIRPIEALGVLLGVIGIVLTWLYRPKNEPKTVHWAHLGETARKETGVGATNVAIWNAGPTVRDSDIPPRRPLQLVAGEGTEIRTVALLATNNPANDVQVHRPDRRKAAAISFAYLDKGNGFVLRVTHLGPASALDLEGAFIGGVGPVWAGSTLLSSLSYLIPFHVRGELSAIRTLKLRRVSGVLTLLCTATAPYVFWGLLGDWAPSIAALYLIPTYLQLRLIVRDWKPALPRGLEAVLDLGSKTA